MSSPIRIAAVLAAGLLSTGAAPPATTTTSCDLRAWGTGPRIEVRASPSARARVLATLTPRPGEEGGQEISGTLPEFHITAARQGWFRISQVSYGDYGDPAPRRRPFAGQGWAHGDRIGAQLMAGRLHAGPSEAARSRPYGKEPDTVVVRRLLDCRGQWARIEADIGTGWVHGLCNNQATTCS